MGPVHYIDASRTLPIWPASLTTPAGAGKMGPAHYIDASRTLPIWPASLTP